MIRLIRAGLPILLVAAIVSSAVVYGTFRELGALTAMSHSTAIPRQYELQGMFDSRQADALVRQWTPGDIGLLRRQLIWDLALIGGYVVLGLSLAGLVRAAGIRPNSTSMAAADHAAMVTAALVVLGAVADVIENAGIASVIAGDSFLQPVVYAAAKLKIAALSVAVLRVIWWLVRALVTPRAAVS